MKSSLVLVFAACAIIAVFIILIVTFVNKPTVDPVKKGIDDCLEIYHYTRSDKLYDECFANMENFK